MEINEKRADSINGKMEKLSATMMQLYSDVLPEEAIEGMLDFATSVADVVDSLGLLQGAIAALGVAGGSQVVSMLASNWTSLISAIKSPLGIASLATGGVVAAISAYRQSVEEMVESARQAGDEWESNQDSLQGQIDKITELPNVENYSDFMRKAQRDKKFERMICDMTTERMVGGNSLRKYRHSF